MLVVVVVIVAVGVTSCAGYDKKILYLWSVTEDGKNGVPFK